MGRGVGWKGSMILIPVQALSRHPIRKVKITVGLRKLIPCFQYNEWFCELIGIILKMISKKFNAF